MSKPVPKQNELTGIVKELVRAKLRGVPLIQLISPDQIQTIENFNTKLGEQEEKYPYPIISWDSVNGWRGLNKLGWLAIICVFEQNSVAEAGYKEMINGDASQFQELMTTELPKKLGATIKLVDALKLAASLPEHTIIFHQNVHRQLRENIPGSSSAAQAILNLRNPFKAVIRKWKISKDAGPRSCVLMMPELEVLPPELRQDIFTLEEALPDREARRKIILDCYEAVPKAVLPDNEDDVYKLGDELKGLNEFAAEQEVALSMTTTGIDLQRLRQRAIRVINQAQGLSVMENLETFDDIGGLENLKTYLKNLATNSPPGAVVFIDEIEKAFAGATGAGGGDLSGTSAALHGEYLKWHEDNKAYGILLVGVPGTGKSFSAKALANFAKVKGFNFELQAMKGGIVGSSTSNIRTAFRIINSYNDKYPLVIATSNDLESLSAELKSRFALVFFVDIPDPVKELPSIWDLQRKAWEVTDTKLPNCDNWTGREVRNCCLNAVKLGVSLKEAAQFVSPIFRTDRKRIEDLRKEAFDRGYISASYSGSYKLPKGSEEFVQTISKGRSISVDD